MTSSTEAASGDADQPISRSTEAVFVDPLTELYHREADVAGAAATRYSRPQAERFGFSECPTCFHRGGIEP